MRPLSKRNNGCCFLFCSSGTVCKGELQDFNLILLLRIERYSDQHKPEADR